MSHSVICYLPFATLTIKAKEPINYNCRTNILPSKWAYRKLRFCVEFLMFWHFRLQYFFLCEAIEKRILKRFPLLYNQNQSHSKQSKCIYDASSVCRLCQMILSSHLQTQLHVYAFEHIYIYIYESAYVQGDVGEWRLQFGWYMVVCKSCKSSNYIFEAANKVYYLDSYYNTRI